MQANLWDIAGGMAVCKVLEMGFYEYNTRKEMTVFAPEFFGEKCQVKNMYIVGFAKDFDELKSLTSGIIEKKSE